MESKKPAPKKIFDITHPRTSGPTSRPSIISNRSTIKNDPMVVTTEGDLDLIERPEPAEPKDPKPESKIRIEPVVDSSESDSGPTATAESAEPTNKTPNNTEDESKKTVDKLSKTDKEIPTETSTIPEPTEKPVTPASDGDTKSDGDAGVPSPDAEDRLKAESDAKQQAEWDKYIADHKFFVPVNEVARKRSVNTSIWLTVLAIILAAALVDMMLDTGLIALIQKIPHTHFFGS
ncbi:MAG: hypothetical protein ABI220_01225 [Candidatus Saccharimonadales bacterium]